MQAKLPDTVARRVAVILGMGRSGHVLLDVLRPLLGEDSEIDLQGVFIVDDELQSAASLPFVKELCRLTLSVQEFQHTHLERSVAMRTRTARKAIAGLARRMGISHTFRDVRGSTVALLQETVHSADITVFEPLQIFTAPPLARPVQPRRPRQRIVVAIDDPDTAAKTLAAAGMLSKGEMHRISILLATTNPAKREALTRMIKELLPAAMVLLSEPGIKHLIAAARAEGAGMLVLGASKEALKPESLQSLREQLHCPICLVR